MGTPDITLCVTQFTLPLQVVLGESDMGFSDRQRVLILLLHYKSLDLSYEEISLATGLAYSSVKARARELEYQGVAYRSDRRDENTGRVTRTLQYREETLQMEIPSKRFRAHISLTNRAAKKQLREFVDKMESAQKERAVHTKRRLGDML